MTNKEVRYDEKGLSLLISEGDEDAFNQLYVILFPEFSAFAFKIVKSEEAVKEVLQESLVRVWLHRDKLGGVDNPRAWYFRIIANECYRHLRKYGLQQRLKEQLDSRQSHSNKHLLHQTELEVSYNETQRIIQQAVSMLSPRQRTIYQLSREEGLTLPEIAMQLNLSRDYVKNVLIAALQVIRQRLTKAGRFIMVIVIFFR